MSINEKQRIMNEYEITNEKEWDIFSRGIELGKRHQEPSGPTLNMICAINNRLDKKDEEDSEIKRAIFGDKEKGEIGMKDMTTEMYTIWKNTNFTGKLLIKIFGVIGIITGSIIGIIELCRRLKS
jgi:hypothetical protein